jgi:PAS domain S-box/PAS domain S-box
LKKEASKNVGGISYLFDITNLRELEKELRESRQCYYDLVEGVNSVVMRMNVNGTITFINKFAEEFFGYSRDELIGQNLVGKIVPKMESTGRDLEEMILEIGKNPEKYRNNINENMRKNGERVWVLWTNRPVPDEQGHVVEVICIGNDITEQKKTAEALRRSEEKYRVTFENTGTAMAVLEEDMAISLINSQFEKLSGYSKEEIEGKVKWPLLVHKEELKRMEEYHRKRRENPDEVPKEYEFKGVIKNGNVRELLITIDIIPGTKKIGSFSYRHHRTQTDEGGVTGERGEIPRAYQHI